MSSAYRWWEVLEFEIIWLRGVVYKMNKRGPSTDPWGTPLRRGKDEDLVPFRLT